MSAGRPSKRRISTGVYRDAYGIEARVQVGSGKTAQVASKRYPSNAPLTVIKKWQDEKRRELKLCRPTSRHTLAHDAERYYRFIAPLASWRERRSEIRAWVALYGDTPRYLILSAHVLDARAKWSDQGRSPKTINHRVNALRHLYRTLDGKRTLTPCDDIDALPTHKTPIVVVTPAVIRDVDETLQAWESTGRLRSPKTRARFRVYASTGRRPSEIMRAEPPDVDLTQRVWRPRDGKGGWGPGIYLNDDMMAAWELFVEASAWGSFRTGSLVRTIRRAGWPDGVRPYNLRHTVGISISEAGGDLADIQAHLGHKHISTTRKHYVPVLNSRMQEASELISGRISWKSVVETQGAEDAGRK